MSVATRRPDGTIDFGGSITGRPMGMPVPMDPAAQASPNYQRQAVIDQLGTSTPATAAARPGTPVATSPGAFARGGQVKQLPGADTKGLAEGIGSTGAGIAGQMIAKQAAQQGASTAAKTGASAASGLGSAATSAGIGLATGYLADKLRVKEDMPTFGGEHGDLTDQYGRRFEGTGGGVASNAARYAGYGAAAGPVGMAAGALAGAIVGGATKNAPSAYTDFRVEDAAKAIGDGYQKYLGRPASDDEIRSQLEGQGWKATGGDRWVGEKNLTGKGGVLDQIRDSPEAQAFRATGQPATARAAVVDQLNAGAAGAPGGAAAAPGVGAPGAPAATPAAGGAPATNPGTWDTDGYAAPQFTAAASGAAPPGWDQTKWANPDHQTPKYAVGRILAGFPPTLEGLAQAADQVAQAYPGTTYNGKDKLTIPGVGTIDVLKGAGKGGEAWQWDDGSGGKAAPAAAAKGGGGAPAADLADGGDLLARLQAEIDRINAGQVDRGEVLKQLQGAA